MRIALVYPPYINSIQTTLPDYVNENEGTFQPLGILYLAAYLKEKSADNDIMVLDAVAEGLDHEEIGQRLLKFNPDIVGISCWTFSLIDSLKVAKSSKEASPQAMVCLGGPHVTIYPAETLLFPEVDFVITGDGEKPFADLVKQLSGEKRFDAVPNLYYKSAGIVKKSGIDHTEMDLNALPFPDRSLVPIRNYYSLLDKGSVTTTMMTSRGCPFQCTFCFQQDSGWRYRDVRNILQEMEHCISIGIRNFFIFDETFTVSKKRTMELCDGILSNKLDITWSCRSRVDTIDDEMMKAMKKAGCTRISFGVESAGPRVLEKLNKKIELARASSAFRMARNNGLITLADFMIACPCETKDVALETIKFAVDLDPDYAQFCLFTLFPATELYREAIETGIVKKDVWLDYAKNPQADFKPPLWGTYNEKESKDILNLAYRRFYARPSYVFKRLTSLKSLKELKHYVMAGIGMLKSGS